MPLTTPIATPPPAARPPRPRLRAAWARQCRETRATLERLLTHLLTYSLTHLLTYYSLTSTRDLAKPETSCSTFITTGSEMRNAPAEGRQ
eukprot:scaffold39353_cov80-Phaeocystis_antarctica.AAC.1